MLGHYLYFIIACRTGLLDNLLCKLTSYYNSGIARFLTIFEKKFCNFNCIRLYTEVVARRCSVNKKDVPRNLEFTGKHMSQSPFFNKLSGLRPATYLKKRLWHRGFSVNFAKFLRIPFLTEHLRWLLLSIYIIVVD